LRVVLVEPKVVEALEHPEFVGGIRTSHLRRVERLLSGLRGHRAKLAQCAHHLMLARGIHAAELLE